MSKRIMSTNYSVISEQNFSIKIVCHNIANAKRDQDFAPLEGRVPILIEELKKIDGIDVFVALEAGRIKNWTDVAAKIERETGLRYECTKRINASEMSFGKAIFINPKTVALNYVQQFWTGEKMDEWSGDYFGNDVLRVRIHPVIDGKVVTNHLVRAAFVHFPMALQSRLNLSKWVNKNYQLAEIWMGDCNTFPDCGGPEMLELICADGKLRDAIPPETKLTFKAFDHDVVEIENEKLSLMNGRIIERGDLKTKILPESILDHVFVHSDLKCKVEVGENSPASDHSALIATVEC